MPKRQKRGTRDGRRRNEPASKRRVAHTREAEEFAQLPADEQVIATAERRVPKLSGYVHGTGIAIRTVRAYVRDELMPDIIERMYEVAMGIQTFDVPTMVGTIVNVPASATVQMNTARALVELGVPKPRAQEGEGMPFAGIIVIGSEGPQLQEARDRARAHRLEDHGVASISPQQQRYLPPPGHQIAIVEDDLSNPARNTGGRDPDAAPDPIPNRPMTKAQEIAARRKANLRRTG